MELRQLRYFVAVAETGNISRAAQKIFLTQPALSRQIKALEEEIGQCLLERRANSIRLTPAGEAMLREAREMLRQAEQAVERVKAAGTGGRLRIGYAPSLAEGLMTPAVTNFSQAHPGTQVEMSDLSTGEMLAGLESGKLDVVVSVAQQRQTSGLHWTTLAQMQWRLAVGQGTGWRNRRRCFLRSCPVNRCCHSAVRNIRITGRMWRLGCTSTASDRRSPASTTVATACSPRWPRGWGLRSWGRFRRTSFRRESASRCSPMLRRPCASRRAAAPTGRTTSHWRCSSRSCAARPPR